jgi:SP family sugar:H+ symporter-like MFS transporter
MNHPSSPEQVNTPFVLLITCVAAIGGFLFGYDSGVINGTVDGLRTAFHSDSVGTGFNVASMLLGCAAGAFFAGRLADRFGRRANLLVAAVFFLVSAWGSGVAGSSMEFVIYRILGGLAVGAASVLAPAYISEIAPARYRGALASVQQIAIISGLFFSFLSNFLIARAAGSSLDAFWWGFPAWRWMFWMEMVPSVIFLAALLLIPESPRYHVAIKRFAHAEKTLGRLFGAAAAARKVEEIRASLAADHRPSFRDLIVPGTHRLRPVLWIGLMLATFQQFVGINVVFYYGSVLWQSAGFTEGDALLINVISGAVSIAACVVAILVIDKLGRKPMLVIGSVGMTLTLGTMAYFFGTAAVGDHANLTLGPVAGPAALVAANLYVIFFNFSWGPVMWVMLGEMFPNQFRGSALAICGLAQWLANFAITMSFPLLLAGLGLGGAYGLYTLSALASIFLVLWLVRETKGRELEQMES